MALKRILRIFTVMPASPQLIEKIKAHILKNGARSAAVKLVDAHLRNIMGLGSSDLADTTTFANGLDEIEVLLGQGDFQEAFEVAKDTAKAMAEEEGFPEDDDEDGLDALLRRGGHLEEVRKVVRDVVKESLQGLVGENFYQNLQPKEAIQKAMVDHNHALKQNNTGQADKIAGNLKSHLELHKYNWQQDPYAMEVLGDFV